MGAKIAGFVTCLMCAIPFFIIGHYKNSNEPIGQGSPNTINKSPAATNSLPSARLYAFTSETGAVSAFAQSLMCAIPFFIIGHYKNSNEPIGLWTEDSRLRTKIHPVKQFNEEMSKVYLCCALVFCVTGLILLLHVMTGFVFLMLEGRIF